MNNERSLRNYKSDKSEEAVREYVSEYMKGRVFNYPQELSRLLLKSKLCSIPSMEDYVAEVKAWSLSVSPPLTGKRILQTVRDIFGIDLFVKVLQ